MGNFFTAITADSTTPAIAGKNANAVIEAVVSRLTLASAMTGADVVAAAETFDADAARVTLFSDIATGKVSAQEAASLLKTIDATERDAARAAKAPPAAVLLNGTPATAAEVKRAFRGAENGTTVEVSSLCGDHTFGLTMFRI